jgi:hypothetical protein
MRNISVSDDLWCLWLVTISSLAAEGQRGTGGTVYSLFLRDSHTRGAETRTL